MKGNGTSVPAGVSLAKTVLITGGAGFIGRALVKRILEADLTTKVIVIDNNCTGDMPKLMKDTERRIVDPRAPDPVRTIVIQHDIRDPKSWGALVDAIKLANLAPIREIYHLACPANVTAFEQFPVETLLTSVVGTGQVLIFAEQLAPKLWPELPPPRMVHVSSSEVYGQYHGYDRGGYEGKATPETYQGDVAFRGPRACYAEGKRAAETLVHDFVMHSQHGLDVRTARLFNVYGPGMKAGDSRVVNQMVADALRGNNLKVLGDGKQTRSFMYVDDAVDALMRLMEASPSESWRPSDPVNLGDPDGEITMLDLAAMIAGIVPQTSVGIEHGPARPDEPRYRVPDISRARAAIPNWSPQTSLVDGLKKTIDYMREMPAKSGEEAALEALRKQNEDRIGHSKH